MADKDKTLKRSILFLQSKQVLNEQDKCRMAVILSCNILPTTVNQK